MFFTFALLLVGALSAILRGGNFHRYGKPLLRRRPVVRQARRPVSLKIYDENYKGDLICTHYKHKAIKKAEVVAYKFPSYDLIVDKAGMVCVNNEAVYYGQAEQTVIATKRAVLLDTPKAELQNLPIPKLEKHRRIQVARSAEEGVNLRIRFTSKLGDENIVSYNQETLDLLGLVRFNYPRYHIDVDCHGTVMINDVIQYPDTSKIINGAGLRSIPSKIVIATTEHDVTIYENGSKVKEIEIPDNI